MRKSAEINLRDIAIEAISAENCYTRDGSVQANANNIYETTMKIEQLPLLTICEEQPAIRNHILHF